MNSNRADLIREHLEYLKRLHGADLTPEMVVKDAQRADSPIHECFEWNDQNAAHSHRIDQARQLIRSVKVIIHTTETTVRPSNFIRNPDIPVRQAGYVTLVELAADHDRAVRAVRAEIDRAEAAIIRAREVAIGVGILGEVEEWILELARRIAPPRVRV